MEPSSAIKNTMKMAVDVMCFYVHTISPEGFLCLQNKVVFNDFNNNDCHLYITIITIHTQ